MRIGIFGGTFNPPHAGHRAAAETAARELMLDRLFVIPAAIPPHKALPENTAPAEDRLAMTQLAFADLDCAEVLGLELERGGSSYTVDTVDELKSRYPDAEIFLLMGTDMFVTLDKWRDADRLIGMITPAVFARGENDERQIADFAEYLAESRGASARIIKNDVIEISSTELRAALAGRGGREYLPDGVYAYIIAHRLYGARPDFPWLREQAYAMLKPKRVPHVMGCEEEAVKLAARWGADEDDAREAAILHDITKKLTLDEQLLLCDKYDIINDNVEAKTLKLLHAKTGAAVARERFGVSDAVYDAIRWHTTGCAGMTLLEKVIYLADYIEPTRDFPGLSELRRLCYEDLDSALLLGLEMSVEDIMSYGEEPHKRTLEAIDYLRTAIEKGTR